MAREIFEVTKDRFHLQDPCCYILQGTWPKEAKMRAKLDGSEVKAEIQRLEVVSALERDVYKRQVCMHCSWYTTASAFLC